MLLFVILSIAARNTKILAPYQRAFLAFSLIIWIIITLYLFAKIVLLIIFEIIRKKHKVDSVKFIYTIFKLCWYSVFGLAFAFMFIGFIYDIFMIAKGHIGTVVFPVVYFIVCFVHVILSFFDFIFSEKYFYLILDNKTIIQSEENREIGLNAQNTHDNNGEEAKVNEEEAKDNKEDVKEESHKSKID